MLLVQIIGFTTCSLGRFENTTLMDLVQVLPVQEIAVIGCEG